VCVVVWIELAKEQDHWRNLSQVVRLKYFNDLVIRLSTSAVV